MFILGRGIDLHQTKSENDMKVSDISATCLTILDDQGAEHYYTYAGAFIPAFNKTGEDLDVTEFANSDEAYEESCSLADFECGG
jgi:hypothetical protein